MAINNNNAIVEYNTIDSDTEAVVLVAEHGNRVGLLVYNDSADNNLLVLWGATATTSDYSFKIAKGALYEMPLSYTSASLTGIWDGDGEGAAQVTEIRDT